MLIYCWLLCWSYCLEVTVIFHFQKNVGHLPIKEIKSSSMLNKKLRLSSIYICIGLKLGADNIIGRVGLIIYIIYKLCLGEVCGIQTGIMSLSRQNVQLKMSGKFILCIIYVFIQISPLKVIIKLKLDHKLSNCKD